MNLANFLFKKENKPSSKTIIEDDIEYNYIKNKRAKYVRIAVKDSNKVYVTVPFYCSYKFAENFVEEKKEWIKEHLNRYDFLKIDENYQTKTNNLIISTGLVQKPYIKKTDNIIQFIYPIGADFYSNEIQNELKKAIKKALYIEAKEYLPKRLEELAKQFNFKYKNVALKTAKTRWGSCSFMNNINLNINLMTVSDELIDYVLIHELCHTVEKNHGEKFWNLVEKCMPEAKLLRKELKKKSFIV